MRGTEKRELFLCGLTTKNAPAREDRGAGKTQGSADEIGHGAAGIFGVSDAVCFAQFDALEQPGHVAAQLPHHGAALFILQHLLGLGAVHHGPVGTADQRHVEELGVLHQLIEGAGGAGAAGRAADGGGLVGQILAARIGQTVHEAGHVAGGRSIVHRRAEDEGIGGLGLLDGLVDHAAEHASIAAAAAAAADAAAHGLTADVQDLGLDALCLQLPGNKGKGSVGAALLVGAAVDEQNFHAVYSPLLKMRRKMRNIAAMIVAQSRPQRNAGS